MCVCVCMFVCVCQTRNLICLQITSHAYGVVCHLLQFLRVVVGCTLQTMCIVKIHHSTHHHAKANSCLSHSLNKPCFSCDNTITQLTLYFPKSSLQKRGRERERERESECVSVCVCVWVSEWERSYKLQRYIRQLSLILKNKYDYQEKIQHEQPYSQRWFICKYSCRFVQVWRPLAHVEDWCNTTGWVWEGDVPPPMQSTKLKITCELKMGKNIQIKQYCHWEAF